MNKCRLSFVRLRGTAWNSTSFFSIDSSNVGQLSMDGVGAQRSWAGKDDEQEGQIRNF